jgi:hypothetical protein
LVAPPAQEKTKSGSREPGGDSFGAAPSIEKTLSEAAPYPFQYPPASWTAALRTAWDRLTSREAFGKILSVSRRFQDSDLSHFLAALSGELGITVRCDPKVAAGPMRFLVGRRVGYEPGDLLLERLLASNGLAFHLEPDGALLVIPREKGDDPELKHARQIRNRLEELEEVRGRFREGWSGSDPRWPVELELTSRRLLFSQEPRNLFQAVVELRRALQVSGSKVYVEIEEFRLKEQGLAWDAPLEGDPPPREGTLEEYVSWLAKAARVGWAVDGERRITFGPPSWAEDRRGWRERVRNAYEKQLAALDRNVPGEGSWTVPALVKHVAEHLGLEVVPCRDAWVGGMRTAGGTYRERLDGLSTEGLRWAFFKDRIYILK